MIHNNKVYANADEKFVKNLILYTDPGSILWHDAEYTTPVLTTELKDIFLNGAVIDINSGLIYTAVVGYDEMAGLKGGNGSTYKATAPTE